MSAKLTPIAELNGAIALAQRSGDDRLYVAQKQGTVRFIQDGKLQDSAVLDISNEVSGGSEQGLLGIAFAPDGSKLYINFTDLNGHTHVQEFAISEEGAADISSRREVLFQEQPFANHNGGNLVFGPDENLWIGLGDGGSQLDPEDRAQNPGTLLGKMLRIDPAPPSSEGGKSYTIPEHNPFREREGALPEIWATGLRNPWRYTFDRVTNDLWIGDVGQFVLEEINHVPAGQGAGANFGWDFLEGTRTIRRPVPEGTLGPVHVYNHDGGRCAVVGGYVYRGSKITNLHGAYLYSDNCDGQIRALVVEGGEVSQQQDLGLNAPQISSFGEGLDGELHVMSLTGGLFRLDPA